MGARNVMGTISELPGFLSPQKATAVCGLKPSLTFMGHGYIFDRFEMNMGAVSKHGHVYVSNMMNAMSIDLRPGDLPEANAAPTSFDTVPEPTVVFHANRPFLYFVFDREDKQPLLVGQFGNPSSSGTASGHSASTHL